MAEPLADRDVEKIVEEALKKAFSDDPDVFRTITVTRIEDWVGDPAYRVTIHLAGDAEHIQRRVGEQRMRDLLMGARETVRRTMEAADLDRRPYVNFDSEQAALEA